MLYLRYYVKIFLCYLFWQYVIWALLLLLLISFSKLVVLFQSNLCYNCRELWTMRPLATSLEGSTFSWHNLGLTKIVSVSVNICQMKWLIMLLIVGMQRLNAPMVGLSVLELLIGLPLTYVPTRYVSVSSSNTYTLGIAGWFFIILSS